MKFGNFVITGHNYINENMFSKLNRLKIGERFTLADTYGRKLEYEIKEIFIVYPTERKCP